jgi:hypothetical protein
VCVSDKRMPRCRVLRSLSDRHKKGKKLKGLDGSYWPMSAFFSCFCFFGGGDNQLFFLLNLKFCLIHICQLRKCLWGLCGAIQRENNRRRIWHVTWRIALLVSWWSQNKIRIQEERCCWVMDRLTFTTAWVVCVLCGQAIQSMSIGASGHIYSWSPPNRLVSSCTRLIDVPGSLPMGLSYFRRQKKK